MRVLFALALLLWSSEAYHTPRHVVKEPIFLEGKTSHYDFELNTTAGIPGMTGQLAKSSLSGVISVMPKSKTEFLLKMDNVKISRPEAGTPSDEKTMTYRRDSTLETELQKSIEFTLHDGKIQSYTLSKNESPESKIIKRSILRHFQGKLQSEGEIEEQSYPYSYDITWNTPAGPAKIWYVVTVSPYPEFPNNQEVFNISATVIHEYPKYTLVHEHHNFEKQGCPEVCTPLEWDPIEDQETIKMRPGCPEGFQPHQMPTKTYLNGQFNFRAEEESMVLESLVMEEKYVASMFDQDMTIKIRAKYNHKAFSTNQIEEARDQQTYGLLELDILPKLDNKQDVAHETAIFAELYSLEATKAVERASALLNKIAETVVENKLETPRTQEVGEDLILLQKILSFLKPTHYQQVWSRIVDKRSYKAADQKETVKRQILVDVLPLVGTTDCLKFIKSLIQEDKLDSWEIKEMLEAIPQNLWKHTEENLKILDEIRKLPQIERHQLLHSAAYLCEARVFHIACTKPQLNEKYETLMRNAHRPSSKFSRHNDDDNDEDELRERSWAPLMQSDDFKTLYQCPKQFLRRFIDEVSQKMRSTRKVGDKAIYIQALAHTGSNQVLEYLAPYLNGSAPETESWVPVDVASIQTETIYALHSIVALYPIEVRQYVSPIYFNRTEIPRVRIAAFSVLIRSQPTTPILNRIARDSWLETSNEVGSYVYSAVTSLGNTSQPCMQLLKDRIQRVISQFKNYKIGFQHAQWLSQSYYNALQNVEIDGNLQYVPSNDTILPHAIFTELRYNLDSLRDTFYEFALNMHGAPSTEFYNLADKLLMGFRKIRSIPKENESKIFGTANIITRLPKSMRLFLYQRIFYTSSYIYIDAESLKNTLEPLFEHLECVLPSSGNVWKGHVVKVYIPSSIHSVSIGYTAIYPVGMDVKHPILLSMKAEVELRRSQPEIHLKVTPSLYYTEHHANEIWSPVDKMAYGIYHEQKFSYTMPLEVVCRLHKQNQTISCDIKWPEMNKRIVRYHSEAGTYASPVTFDRLPSTVNRRPIATIPVMFRKEQVLGLPTLPKVYVTAHTEDMSFGYDDLPRSWEESVDLAIQHLRNPGWRRKSINATLVPSPEARSQTHGVRVQISYNMSHESIKHEFQSDKRNMSPMTHDDDEDELRLKSDRQEVTPLRLHGNLGLQKSNAENIYKNLMERPHIAHELSIEAYSWPSNVYAQLRMELNHTYDKTKYSFTARGALQGRGRQSDYKACIAHVTKYGYIPSELKYKISSYYKQVVDFYNEMSFCSDCEVFRNPQFVTLGTFAHKPHHNLLENEDDFDNTLEEKWLMPETHDECMEDMQNGKNLSPECIRAIREETIYNNYRIRTEWLTEIPPIFRNITEKLNQAVKYALYPYADINNQAQNKKSVIEIDADYVTMLTDNPVFNVHVQTPGETVHYHKVPDVLYMSLPSSFHDLDEVILRKYTNNTYPPTCAIMKEHVKTYDDKTFPLLEDSCTYLLSAHCSSKKMFAVLGKNLKGSKTELTIYIARHEIVLHPNRGSVYPVEVNGKRYNIDPKSPVVLDEESGIYVFVIPAGSTKYNLVLRYDLGLKIVYDGENIKIQVQPWYKGELCGLCSEFDGELTREYRGLDQCLYMDSQDFAHSSIVDSQKCGVSRTPKFPKLCDFSSNPDSHYQPHDNEDEDNSIHHHPGQRQPKLRTIHTQKNQDVCFSTQPVYMCDDGIEPEEIERKSLQFHCLPKYDAVTRKLVAESEHRILRELANKRVDFSDTISVAKSCRQ